MNAGVITIGSELLYGRTLDSNFLLIAKSLSRIGITVEEHVTVNDSIDDISEAFGRLIDKYDIIISTGGLGPTFDDLTRQGFAKSLDVELLEDPTSLIGIYEKLAFRRIEPSELSKRQALFPRGSKPIPNPVGIAPAILFEGEGSNKTTVFCLPGVPQEFTHLFNNVVIPYILERNETSTSYSSVKLIGLPEVHVSQYLESISSANIDLAINVDGTVITIHISASSAHAKNIVTEFSEKIVRKFGSYVFSTRSESLEEVIGRILTERKMSIGCVESCTGGMLSKRITDVVGSSAYFKGSLITYSDEMKKAIGVAETTLDKYGAVSSQTAKEMAIRGRIFLKTDLTVSITGIAGPTGGSDEKPVGTVHIAVDGSNGVMNIAKQFGGSRNFNRLASTNYSMFLIWKYLSEMQRSDSK